MRLKIAIALAILGLLVLGTGIGQRTIWLPPATLTASAPANVAPAPLTVISPGLLKTRDGHFSMTVKNDGPIQLVVGRQDDVAGWVGNAAHTEFGVGNKEFTELTADSVKGEEKVPNPSGSDLWVSEEKGTGELTYTWQAPGHGDWALLLSSDGTAPAPTDISFTVDNETGTPWAVPLMVLGSALLALAALLFVLAPRKPKPEAAVVQGRRAAGRMPADPATGALEVAKIVAAREAAQAAVQAKAAGTPADATIAEVNSRSRRRAAGGGAAGAASGAGAAAAGAGDASARDRGAQAPGAGDATSSLPLSLHNPSPAKTGASDAAKGQAAAKGDAGAKDGTAAQDTAAKTDAGATNNAGAKDGTAAKTASAQEPSLNQDDAKDVGRGDAKKQDASDKSDKSGKSGTSDSDDNDPTPGAGSGAASSGAESGTAKPQSGRPAKAPKPAPASKRKGKNLPQDKQDKQDKANPQGNQGSSEAKGGNDPKGGSGPKGRNGGKNLSVKARWGAALAAVLLAGSVTPAIADDATTAPPAAETPAAETPAATTPAAQTPSAPVATNPTETAGFPNLLDSQIQRIAGSVASVVASGDNARNATELESRVAGMALEVRAANYKIRAQVESQAPVEPVNATKLLAKVVSTSQSWPRSAMFVTQGENNELPQLLTLVQASPRENYKLIKATPLLPGQTFPKVDKEGTKPVDLKSGDGLKMSPDDAIAALSDRLTNPDSKFKDSFKDSVYITSVLDLQKQVAANAKDADYVFSHKADLESAVSFRTADGGAMVVVGNTFGIDATSKAEATLTVGDDAAVFTGGKETTAGFTLAYAEPVVLYIPPTGGGDQLTILSATRNLVSGSFK